LFAKKQCRHHCATPRRGDIVAAAVCTVATGKQQLRCDRIE